MDIFSMLGIPKENIDAVAKLVPLFGEKLAAMEEVANKSLACLERIEALLEESKPAGSFSHRQIMDRITHDG